MRAPRSNELNLAEVKASLANTPNPFNRLLEVSRLGRVVRASSLFQSGHLLLRRGGSSVPTFSVNGTVSSQLSQHLGAHAALQMLKQRLDRQEKKVRHQLVTLLPKLRGQGLANSEVFRSATSEYVAWCKAGATNSKRRFTTVTAYRSNT